MDSPRLPSDRIGSQICHCAPPGGESPPDLSLRGSAGAAAISQYTPGTQESPGEIATACRRFPRRFAPRNDTGGRHSQACHCAPPGGESPPDLSLRGSAGAVAISQYTPGTQESPGEFDSACLRFPRRFAPRNDTGGRHSQICHCAPPGGESPPDLSLRGSAGAVAISQYTPGTQESPGEFAGAYLRLPRRACAILAMTREEGTLRLVIAPLRMGKAPLTCHYEAPQEPWQSRSTRPDRGKAIGESATASPRFPRRFAPRNDKLGGLMP